jgi:hypothetical protein
MRMIKLTNELLLLLIIAIFTRVQTKSIIYPDENNPVYDEYDETFFDYAEKMNEQLRLKNELKMNDSIEQCNYVSKKTIHYLTLQCSQIKFELNKNDHDHDSSATKLFLIDNSKIGLLSTSFMLISIYSKTVQNKFELLKRNYFSTDKIPYDACTNYKTRHVFILFAFQNEIGKFKLNQSNDLVKIKSISDHGFIPSAIACLNNEILVNDHSKNQIRVYDYELNLINIIQLKNVIYSSNNAIAGDTNVKLFLDGNDGVALFDTNYNKDPNINTCHFYHSKFCIEDIHVYFEQLFKSSIYITNSCSRSIKKYFYNKYGLFSQEWDYMINMGKPISAVRNSYNELIVLTQNPNMIQVLNLNECYDWND